MWLADVEISSSCFTNYIWEKTVCRRVLNLILKSGMRNVRPGDMHVVMLRMCFNGWNVCYSQSSSSVICQTKGPNPLPKRFLHLVRSRASSFNWKYPLLFLRSSSSFLRLLATSICPFIFPSIICCRRQFLRKMWPIKLAFRFLISCRIFYLQYPNINYRHKK